jgi:hypothetical protein
LVRLIKRSTGRAVSPIPTSTRRDPAERNREQQQLIDREVDILWNALPRFQARFIGEVESLAASVLHASSTGRRHRLSTSQALPGIPLLLEQHILNYPDYAGTDFYATELTVSPTGGNSYNVVAGRPRQRYANRFVVTPSILDPQSDHWENAAHSWSRDMSDDKSPEDRWDADEYLFVIETDYFIVGERLREERVAGQIASMSSWMPFSLARAVMSDARTAKTSWPQDEGLVPLIIQVNGSADRPEITLLLDNPGLPARPMTFKVPACNVLRDWETFLDPNRWKRVYRRWACWE